ncbi:MAG: ATP-grasp domain-containing protein [Clostridia bacterium]|nr:ATP-grasp domain-containing protein [Clostridia bacterium]
MKNIAVFFGGQSVEHDISVITGVMAVNTLDKEKYNAIPVYVDKAGGWYTGESLVDPDNYKNLNYKKLKKVAILGGDKRLFEIKGKRLKPICSIAACINCMHGERGEDGSLSGLLNMCKIPLASPSIAPSAVCMDKGLTKTLLKGLKIKTLSGICVSDIEQLTENSSGIEYPVIVKPNSLGSSIGINRADNEKELLSAVNYALKFGDCALIEPCLENFIEINCAAYLNSDGKITVSECERPVGRSEILTFNDKYRGGKRVFPADIDKKISDKIKGITEKIYRELSFSGVIRIDYFLTGGQIFVNEINTVPGSLAYYLFSDTLKGFKNMLNELITVAEKNFAKSSTVQKTYNSGILLSAGAKGAKRL